jgi:DNA polymerase-4
LVNSLVVNQRRMSSSSVTPRTIIHVDLDAFFCAVEEQRDPMLKGKAFAVGGRPQDRGVVASCSYMARMRGIHSAMSMAAALRLCPNLIIVPSRHSEYRLASNKVMEVLRARTSQVEQISIDEAFLDVSELVNENVSGRDIALELQAQIQNELALSCSVGVASNKMVAKIATDCGKSTVATGNAPHAICVVPAGEEAQFLSVLPVNALWGVGPKMAARLNQMRIKTIGQLAQWPQLDLCRRFGKHGYELSLHAQGIDNREIVTERESKSVSSETTFINDVNDGDELRSILSEQARQVAWQLNRQNLQGSTVKIKLRWTDFSIVTRQITLPQPTAQYEIIEQSANQLLTQLWQNERPVRLLGVGVSGFSVVRQLGLFDSGESAELPRSEGVINERKLDEADQFEAQKREEKRLLLRAAMEKLEARFGVSVVQIGTQLNKSD